MENWTDVKSGMLLAIIINRHKLGETDIVFTTSSSWSSLTELYIYTNIYINIAYATMDLNMLMLLVFLIMIEGEYQEF